ncbi:MAG: 50S ribosomal protein L1 [Candidatus Omnitrophica bacterium]|nr:50S ribosomal protein L1 [Candidatus Omnitrophota bacterium]
MSDRSKRYDTAQEKRDRQKAYLLDEAFQLIRNFPRAKFNETVDVALTLGIDPKQSDQAVRGSTVLPHGTGKSRRVLVFCKGEVAQRAKEEGADYVGADDLIQKIQDGWLDFDVAIATPDMMKDLGKVGRVLGPRGLMPNPKTGTVTQNVEKVIKEAKAGRIEFKNDKTGVVHTIIGKISFEEKALKENLQALVDAIKRLRPQSVKGQFIKNIYISTTMGPSIKIALNEIAE